MVILWVRFRVRAKVMTRVRVCVRFGVGVRVRANTVDYNQNFTLFYSGLIITSIGSHPRERWHGCWH